VISALVYATITRELRVAEEYARNVAFASDMDLDAFLVAYGNTVVSYSLVEYGSLVLGGLGLVLLVVGPQVLRRMRASADVTVAPSPSLPQDPQPLTRSSPAIQ
jgi:hypothetical protein